MSIQNDNQAKDSSTPAQSQPTPNQNFVCSEQVDLSASDAFKDPLPGAWDLHRETTPLVPLAKPANRFRTELDPDDVKLVNELGQLTPDNLMEYVKNLQNNAFALGQEEARQFARAKFLKILEE
uniref:Uncharacterized protein n=1 Tax=Acrobeloides nanus TaxID=290746 RepID=A0A914D1Y4_9BILA